MIALTAPVSVSLTDRISLGKTAKCSLTGGGGTGAEPPHSPPPLAKEEGQQAGRAGVRHPPLHPNMEQEGFCPVILTTPALQEEVATRGEETRLALRAANSPPHRASCHRQSGGGGGGTLPTESSCEPRV